MTKHRWIIYLSFLVFFFGSVFLSYSQADEIIENNIQAAGGKENLSKVKNYSFKYGTTTYYMSADGLMKLTEGREPIITEVTLVEQDKVKRNCFNKVTELSGLQKSTYLCLAKLRCGLFTLKYFKGKLESKGLKSFGPKNHHMFTTHVGDLEVDFYLDSEEFTLKRMVLKGFDPSQDKYEINHDFGPYQEINGVKIPSSWFGSQVGTRGRNYEISDVKINQNLADGFFSKIDINAGKVEITEGALKGNIIESGFQRNMLQIATNWTDECIKRAGFKTKSKLVLQISDKEIEIDFYESFPPRSSIGPGAKFMVPNQRGDNYIIYLISPEYEKLAEKLEPLLPIRVKKK